MTAKYVANESRVMRLWSARVVSGQKVVITGWHVCQEELSGVILMKMLLAKKHAFQS